jgi:hypothetical protein
VLLRQVGRAARRGPVAPSGGSPSVLPSAERGRVHRGERTGKLVESRSGVRSGSGASRGPLLGGNPHAAARTQIAGYAPTQAVPLFTEWDPHAAQ